MAHDQTVAGDTDDPQVASRYLAELSSGLASGLAAIARRHGFDTLGYLLDIARLEAETIARQNRGGRH